MKPFKELKRKIKCSECGKEKIAWSRNQKTCSKKCSRIREKRKAKIYRNKIKKDKKE
jgi:endogenous inhibitor of DNA gyrase (YacG/DUF329 family)